jgi:hypothetical protein
MLNGKRYFFEVSEIYSAILEPPVFTRLTLCSYADLVKKRAFYRLVSRPKCLPSKTPTVQIHYNAALYLAATT